jgi:hypothetical protein
VFKRSRRDADERTMGIRPLAALLLIVSSIPAAAGGAEYGSLQCEVLDERQTRAANHTARRMHFVYCVDTATGDMLGLLVRRNGSVACTETGHFDAGTQSVCRNGGTCPAPGAKGPKHPAR